jgi:tetraacyldisaccharide-1-P 4'-kinase
LEEAKKKKKSEEKEKEKEKETISDYQDLENKLIGTMLKQSQVMAAAGLGNPKSATDRSLFSKKLRKEKNDLGGVYQFNDDELASVTKVVSNPAAFLSTKKGKSKK